VIHQLDLALYVAWPLATDASGPAMVAQVGMTGKDNAAVEVVVANRQLVAIEIRKELKSIMRQCGR
jgi:hypothetical protein